MMIGILLRICIVNVSYNIGDLNYFNRDDNAVSALPGKIHATSKVQHSLFHLLSKGRERQVQKKPENEDMKCKHQN